MVLLYTKTKGKWKHKIYFSTDLSLSHAMILKYYPASFPIAFLYRDGKQHTGLNDSQTRSVNKLNFHFNTSLTAIHIAKTQHWVQDHKEQKKYFQ